MKVLTTKKAMTGTELGERPLASAREMKIDKNASWVLVHGTKVLSERDSGVRNPSEAVMNSVVQDLRS